MFRRLLAVFAVALLAASCSSSDTLATVNGEEITKDDLFAIFPDFEDENAITGEDLRQAVSNLIVLTAEEQAAADDFNLAIDDAAIDARLANPPARYASVLNSAELSETTRRANALVTLIYDLVSTELIVSEAGGYERLLAESPNLVTRVCIRHISVATVEEANAVLDRLDAGEDFATVSGEVSLDLASPDGLMVDERGNCLRWLSNAEESLSGAALTADLNIPAGPVAFGAGFSVIRVEDRVGPTSIADLEANFMDYIELGVAGATYSKWVSDTVRGADIEVSATLGRWSVDGFGIAPPGE